MSVPFHLRPLAGFAPLLLLIAGCAGFQASNGIFSVTASSASVSTTGQIHLKATKADGSPAAVSWTLSAGQGVSSLGAGTIDATGLYTPPSAIMADSMQVVATAHSQSDPSVASTIPITVTPGFLQPLLPENAAVSSGSTVELKAEIAEVSSGNVHWSLSDGAAGTLGASSCHHASDQYTTCTASFTAPSGLAGTQSIYVNATVNDTNTQLKVHLLLNPDGVNSSAAINQSAQPGLVSMGATGSNDNDYDVYQAANGESYIADCCGGTLGALVEDTQHNQYILSNNHVLAESDQGKIGDTIDQPGLIDSACRPLSQPGSTVRSIGALSHYVPIASSQTNVDAALASINPGTVNPDGSILQLGTPGTGANGSLGAAPPVAGNGEVLNADTLNGLKIVKSGRTTGLTCSTVESVDLTVKVDYYKDCAETQPYYTKLYTGQIGIAGNSFSDSGDSGALVVDAANSQPVGLFYAGGTDGQGNGLSVANPIGDVLNALGTQTGSRMSIVGTRTPHPATCLNYDKNTEASILPELSSEAQTRAQSAVQSAATLVNHDAGILGVAPGKSADSPGEAGVIVYVDKAKTSVNVPHTVGGVRTTVVFADAASVANGTAPKLPTFAPGISLSSAALARASAVQRQYAPQLLDDPAIFGVGVTQSRDNPQEPALLILVDMAKTPNALPATVGGIRTQFLQLHRFHVTKSRYAEMNPAPRCSLQPMARPK